jgi:hypothetical protein
MRTLCGRMTVSDVSIYYKRVSNRPSACADHACYDRQVELEKMRVVEPSMALLQLSMNAVR